MTVVSPTVVVGIVMVVAGVAWLTQSGWALVVGGVALLAFHFVGS